MPRKYDRVIRYYASWFDDLLEPEKELTPAECWAVMLAIKECQIIGSLEPLQQLPVSTRRALSMATMGEQIMRLLERAERMRERGSKGGRANQERVLTPEQQAAASMRAEKEAKEVQERDAAYEAARKGAIKPSEYEEMLVKAAKGDAEILAKFGMSQDAAIKLCNRKRIPL